MSAVSGRVRLLALGDWSSLEDEPPAPFVLDGDVAVVTTSGLLLQNALFLCDTEMIAGYDTIGSRLRAAFESKDVATILHVIDSPGGDCAGCAELASSVVEWSAQSGKSVVVYGDETVASAAYWQASSASEIITPRTGRFGSIGTVAVAFNVAGSVEAKGGKAIVSASPKGKALAGGALVQPMSDEKLAAYQARMDRVTSELTAIFAGDVAARRKMSVEAVMALDAEMFTGARAVDVGLVDRVGGMKMALDVARSKRKRKDYSMGVEIVERSAEHVSKTESDDKRRIDLGSEVEKLTGQLGAAAVEVVRAWHEGHAKIGALENRVKVERLRGRDANKVPPSAAFAQLSLNATLSDGKTPHPSAGLPHPDAGPHADFAAMSLGVFDARLDGGLIHPAAARPPAAERVAENGLSAADREYCERHGLDEKDYKAAGSRLFGGG